MRLAESDHEPALEESSLCARVPVSLAFGRSTPSATLTLYEATSTLKSAARIAGCAAPALSSASGRDLGKTRSTWSTAPIAFGLWPMICSYLASAEASWATAELY